MRRLVTISLVLAVAVPTAAAADHPFGNIGWPNRLPPRAGVGPAAHPAEPCLPEAPSCVDDVIARMTTAWKPLDASCDHRAVFALTYLMTTEGFRAFLSDRREQPFFADERWIIELDRGFADLYFDAVDEYPAGTAPAAWRIAFDAARGGHTNGIQDLFLGMNAHIQRDLPVALVAAGLVGPAGSHKPDHDRVNVVLNSVVDPIEDALADRYDPLIRTFDASPSPADEQGALEMMKSWREEAWRNAERLALARTPLARRIVMDQIETYSAVWAQMIKAADFGWYAARRDAYCRLKIANPPPGGTTNA